jgi:hypothetical protein
MPILETFLALVTGIGLRLVIPIAVTILVIWLLKRLDQRWQAEADAKPGLAHAKPGNPGCWNVKNCSEEARSHCKAYANPQIPCWQVKRSQNGTLQEQCLGCQVFENAVPVTV